MGVTFKASRLAIPDLILVESRRFRDPRGAFAETYRASAFAEIGVPVAFVQDNEALSMQRGTARGLHFQAPPFAQAKLVRVLSGAIVDVAVDLRQGSASYGRGVAVEMTAEAGTQLYVPHGFAHGYCTLADDTLVAYKCDAYYAPEAEGGILFDDPDLAIDWPVAPAICQMSDRDRGLPRLSEFISPFRA